MVTVTAGPTYGGPAPRHYAGGTRFEHKVIKDLETNGYATVRAAGSKGAMKIDVLAAKPGQLLFVQCKRSGVLPPDEWDTLYACAGWVGALPILASNGERGRGVQYIRLAGPKERGRPMRNQPWSTFVLDEVV